MTTTGQDSILVVGYDLSILPTDSLKEYNSKWSEVLSSAHGSAQLVIDCNGWKLKIIEPADSKDVSVYELNVDAKTLYSYAEGDKDFCRKNNLGQAGQIESTSFEDTISVLGYRCSRTTIQSDFMNARVYHSDVLKRDFRKHQNGLKDELSLILGQTNSIPLRIELLSEDGVAWMILESTGFSSEKRKKKDWRVPKFKEEQVVSKLGLFN